MSSEPILCMYVACCGIACRYNVNDTGERRYIHWVRWVSLYLYYCANNVYAFQNLAFSKTRCAAVGIAPCMQTQLGPVDKNLLAKRKPRAASTCQPLSPLAVAFTSILTRRHAQRYQSSCILSAVCLRASVLSSSVAACQPPPWR